MLHFQSKTTENKKAYSGSRPAHRGIQGRILNKRKNESPHNKNILKF